jgi:hypothetical protein
MALLQRQREILARAIAGRSLDSPSVRGLLNVRLRVYESGRPAGPPSRPSRVMCKDNDLILDNLGQIYAALFGIFISNTAKNITLTDNTNTSRTVMIWDNGNSAAHMEFVANASYTLGTRVGVGNPDPATAPTRGDYNLQSQIGSWTSIGTYGSWTSATGKVQFAGSVLLDDGGTVTEAGVLTRFRLTAAPSYADFLLLRDTFEGVEIPPGKYAHVEGELQL